MKDLNVELPMGHDIGLNGSYYKPTEQEPLQNYLKAVLLLTIDYDIDKSLLQKQMSEVQRKTKNKIISLEEN